MDKNIGYEMLDKIHGVLEKHGKFMWIGSVVVGAAIGYSGLLGSTPGVGTIMETYGGAFLGLVSPVVTLGVPSLAALVVGASIDVGNGIVGVAKDVGNMFSSNENTDLSKNDVLSRMEKIRGDATVINNISSNKI